MDNNLFDYSEQPIRDWITKITNVNLYDNTVNTKALSVQGINCKYNLYLSLENERNVDIEDYTENNNLRKSVSLLYDSVRHAYHPIAKFIEHEWDENQLNPMHIMPYFDEYDLSFSVKPINKYGLEKIKIIQKLDTVTKELSTGSDIKLSIERNNLINQLSQITDEIYNKEEERCLKLSEKEYPKLYIVIKKVKNTIGSSLPKF